MTRQQRRRVAGPSGPATRALLVACVLIASLLAPGDASAAAAASWVADVLPAPALTDSDGDRISDDLERDLLDAATGRLFDVIVRMKPGVDVEIAELGAGSLPMTRELALINGFATSLTGEQALDLARSDRVLRIERDAVIALADEATMRDHGVATSQAAFGLDGAGVGICIIDSGADPNHEQLDDGKIVGWIDLVSALPTPYDDHSGGHGTHVASIAAGDGQGGPLASENRGVAPGADLYIAKAFAGLVVDDVPVVSPGTAQASMVITAIEWCAAEPGVDIISMSFTATGPADGTDALSVAVEEAVLTHGKVAVAAAGNDGPNPGFLGSPGASAHAITVGAGAEWSAALPAVYRSEGPFLAAFSSRGPTLDGRIKPDIVAPGHSVQAAAANSVAAYSIKDGTSMATPFVAGSVALALEANPALGPEDVAGLIEATAIDRGPLGKDIDWGAGLIDVFGLVSLAGGLPTYQPTAFPRHTVVGGRAVPAADFTHAFELGPGDLSIPIAATIISDGGPDPASGNIFWKPDLEAELRDPNGLLLDRSQCPVGSDPSDCLGNLPNSGRQELLHSLPTVPGTYTITVAAAADDGGSFIMDLSHGPVEVGNGHIPPVGGGKVTAGGYLDATNGKKVNIGGKATSDLAGGVSGNWTLHDKPAGVKIHIEEVTAIGGVANDCGSIEAGSASVEFWGTGTFNGEDASFRVCVEDNGEPGNSGPSSDPDAFYLDCLSGCDYDTGTRTDDDLIDGGNIQVHRAGGGDLPGSGGIPGGARVLVLDPMLTGESLIGATQVLTVRAYDAAGDVFQGAEVTMSFITPTGLVSLIGVTGINGLVDFPTTIVAGDVAYQASVGDIVSNYLEISGML